jgi:hypothetical protein
MEEGIGRVCQVSTSPEKKGTDMEHEKSATSALQQRDLMDIQSIYSHLLGLHYNKGT